MIRCHHPFLYGATTASNCLLTMRISNWQQDTLRCIQLTFDESGPPSTSATHPPSMRTTNPIHTLKKVLSTACPDTLPHYVNQVRMRESNAGINHNIHIAMKSWECSDKRGHHAAGWSTNDDDSNQWRGWKPHEEVNCPTIGRECQQWQLWTRTPMGTAMDEEQQWWPPLNRGFEWWTRLTSWSLSRCQWWAEPGGSALVFSFENILHVSEGRPRSSFAILFYTKYVL